MAKFAEILGRITDAILLSVLWLVFSLPIFTIGASITALYHTVTKVYLNDRGYIVREFWDAFKKNFKQSTIVWLILMLATLILAIDFWFLKNFLGGVVYDVLLLILLYLLINIAMLVNCMFPSIARFEATVRQLYKNCFIIILANLPWNILALIVLAVVIVVVYLSPITILVMPTIYMICQSKIFEKIFKKYINDTK